MELIIRNKLRTSSPMISEGRRPGSSGGISDPRLDEGPEPGVKLPLRKTSILGIESAGVLISGTFAWKMHLKSISHRQTQAFRPAQVIEVKYLTSHVKGSTMSQVIIHYVLSGGQHSLTFFLEDIVALL